MKASQIVYTPLEVATLGSEYLDFRRSHKDGGLPFPAAKMTSRVYPMFPGEMMSIIARPGHAKTSFMMFWARQRAAWLRENAEGRVAVYATWEQSIEELHAFYVAASSGISITDMAMGNVPDWEKVIEASARRSEEPLWFIGHSVMRQSGRKPVTIETLTRALEEIQKLGKRIDSVFVDYLQRIPPVVTADNPVVAYSATIDHLKNLALGFAVPVVLGVQASREVDSLKMPIPQMNHAQWTSNVEQSSDRVISLVRPRRYVREGEMFGSHRITGHNQLLVSVLKQKLGEANFAEWLTFNPIYNRLDEAELIYGGV